MSKDSRTKLQKLLALAKDPSATTHERSMAKSKAEALEKKNPSTKAKAKVEFNFSEFTNTNSEHMRNWGWTGFVENPFTRRTASYELIICPLCGREARSFTRWIDRIKNETILEYRHDIDIHTGRFTSV